MNMLAKWNPFAKTDELDLFRPTLRMDPLREMEDLVRGMQRAFAAWPAKSQEAMTMADWSPSVDIGETDKESPAAIGFRATTRHGGMRGARMRNVMAVLVAMLIPAAALAQENLPPVADAGPDQNIYVYEGALLFGSAVDPEGDRIIAWRWNVEEAPAGSLRLLNGPLSRVASLDCDLPGDYVVSLRASDGTWGPADTVVIHCTRNLPPVAVAQASVVQGPAPLTVTFDGTQSYDPEGASLSYLWNFGDGGSSYGATVQHVFNYAGEYYVGLTVFDDFGNTDVSVVIITATEPNNPPTIAPVASPVSGSAPLLVSFAANATDPEGDLLSYAWDFGDPASDDNTSTEANPSHLFENPGAYTVWLTVSDGVNEVSESLLVTVDSSISFSVHTATVKLSNNSATTGTVTLWADFDADLPQPDDLVSVVFDGVTLLEAPFSEFRLTEEQQYLLNGKGLVARLDFAAARLFVISPRLVLFELDVTNGVLVELTLGDAQAVENIDMAAEPGSWRLVYRRADVAEGEE